MNRECFQKAIVHPLPVAAVSFYLVAMVITVIKGGNITGIPILALVLVLFAATIAGSIQTGVLQMYQGRGATRGSQPARFWFHLCSQVILWLIFNAVFGLAVWASMTGK